MNPWDVLGNQQRRPSGELPPGVTHATDVFDWYSYAESIGMAATVVIP